MDERCHSLIEQTAMSADPFPHMVVDGIFEAELYAKLRAALPEPSAFGPGSFGHIRIGAEADELFSPMPEHLAATWQLTDDLWRGTIAPTLAKKFLPHLDRKLDLAIGTERPRDFECQPDAFQFTPLIMQRRYRGEVQTPHMDNATSLFTAIFYLCGEDADPRDGVVMYKARDQDRLVAEYQRRRQVRAWYPDADDYGLTRVSQLEYRANRMIAFFSSPISLHSVSIDHNEVRYSMQAQAPVPASVGDALFGEWGDDHVGRSRYA